MGGTTGVALAVAAFVGTHFLLSHPLRAPLVARIGERGFAIVYSLVAAATLLWIVFAYRGAPPTPMLWPVGDALWAVGSAIMLVAAILLMGSLIRNPALPTGGAPGALPADARDVFAITRHPMLWSFALWALAHVLVYPVPRNIIVAAGMALLSLVGAAAQDAKKERLEPARWRAWEAKTSFWPFAAIAAGRARLRLPRPHTLAGGVVLWLVATWAHLPLAGWPAGIWRWLP